MIQLICFLLIFSLFFSPIYLWESGLPQICHSIVFVGTVVILIYNFIKKRRIVIKDYVKIALLFAIYASIINCYYYDKYKDVKTL